MSRFKWNPFTIEGEAPGSVRYISFGSQKSKSSPARVSMWNPGQKATFAGLWPQIAEGVGTAAPSYPKPMYVPKTPEEEAYLSSIPSLAGEIGAARGRLGEPAYEITPETTEAYYQEAVRAPMMKEWQETVEPMIREAYAGPGYWGSARAEAQTKGAETLATTLGAKRAELSYADEMARRAALESAAGREATGALPYAAGEAQMLGSAGQYSRMIDQEEVQADMQRWLMGEEVEGVTPTQYNPFLQLAFQILGLDPYALGTKSSSSGWNFGIAAGQGSGATGYGF